MQYCLHSSQIVAFIQNIKIFGTKNVQLMMQIIFGNRWRHLLGEKDFWEHVGGIDISLAPSSFGQANTRVDKIFDQANSSSCLIVHGHILFID